jgi:hypothetical protein
VYEQQGNALPALETYEQAIQILDSQARHGTARHGTARHIAAILALLA